MQTPIFSNSYDIYDLKLKELVTRWDNYQNEIEGKILDEIEYQLGRDYYVYAKKWLDKFKDAEWWRDDLI